MTFRSNKDIFQSNARLLLADGKSNISKSTLKWSSPWDDIDIVHGLDLITGLNK